MTRHSRRKIPVAAAAMAAALALLASARAQEPSAPDETRSAQEAIRAVDNSVSVAYAPLHVFYQEPSDGGIPFANYDTEDGTLTDGGQIAVSLMRSFGSWKDAYVQASLSRASGSLPYDGTLSLFGGATTIPFDGTSGARINDWGLRLGKGVEVGERWLWTPYLSYGYHTWARSLPAVDLPGIDNAPGFTEIYSHHSLQVGNRVQYAPVSRVVLTVDGRFGTTLDPEIRSPDIVPNGTFDERLGAAPVIDLEAEVDYAVRAPVHLFAGWHYSRYGYGQSGVNAASGLIEPISTTELMTYLIGARFSFR
ncbi:MAG: hypothetical protein ACHQ49_15740 [Elusimicrobiota bacterium]